ncbi:MAG TPA: dihydrodipicolinate reductase C-terminal domain-containing protein [Gemmatimonadaceae bacterium]|nr:dihydrodipicolinate reductase C-terminal domain-containing protein [Gemmatimonadaceae bacterium]
MRVLLIGDGKMGRALEQLARERGHPVVAVLGARDDAAGGAIATLARESDVAIEFTEPQAARANVTACLRAGLPVVTGTTGWYEALPDVEREARARDGALFWSPNFSLGVALAIEVARQAGAIFAPHAQFDVHLVETHHRAKQDAPSGTGAAMAAATEASLGRPVPTTSVRVGHVPGTHALVFDGPYEQVMLTHEARDRRVFADGALRAAEWLVGRRGVFTMRDLVRAQRANEPAQEGT